MVTTPVTAAFIEVKKERLIGASIGVALADAGLEVDEATCSSALAEEAGGWAAGVFAPAADPNASAGTKMVIVFQSPSSSSALAALLILRLGKPAMDVGSALVGRVTVMVTSSAEAVLRGRRAA